MDPDKIAFFQWVGNLAPLIVTIVAITVGGWVITTWLRIKHGYPIDSFGQAVHPHTDKQSVERIKLLSNENAQLRAEIGSMKDRLETIERIVTDQPSKLAQEIDRLAIDKGGRA